MKEDADAVVETKEDALEVAEDVLDEAIKTRDDAYLDAGVNGNAELLARDEAMEEAAESYEQAHAARLQTRLQRLNQLQRLTITVLQN